eukprot:gene4454-14606_t
MLTSYPRFRPDLYFDIEKRSGDEGFMEWLFGGDCYSQALAEFDGDCRSLSDDGRTRLSVKMSNCFLKASEAETYRCTSRMSIKECTSEMDDRAFALYSQFFTNIHSICLFVQNQDFMKSAETLVNSMHNNSLTANNLLHELGSNIREQHKEIPDLGITRASISSQQQNFTEAVDRNYQAVPHDIQDLDLTLASLSSQQQNLAEGVDRNYQAVQTVSSQAMLLQEGIQLSLSIGEEVHQKQKYLMTGLQELEELEMRRAEEADAQWQAFSQHTAAMLQQQKVFELLQQQHIDSVGKLTKQMNQLDQATDNILQYASRSHALLGVLMGRQLETDTYARTPYMPTHHVLRDILFYASTAAIVFLLGSCAPSGYGGMRPALLGVLLLTWMVERHIGHAFQSSIFLSDGGKALLKIGLGQLHDSGIPSEHQYTLDYKSIIRTAFVVIMVVMILWRWSQLKACASENSNVLQSIEHSLMVLRQQQQETLEALSAMPNPRQLGANPHWSSSREKSLPQISYPTASETGPPYTNDQLPSAATPANRRPGTNAKRQLFKSAHVSLDSKEMVKHQASKKSLSSQAATYLQAFDNTHAQQGNTFENIHPHQGNTFDNAYTYQGNTFDNNHALQGTKPLRESLGPWSGAPNHDPAASELEHASRCDNLMHPHKGYGNGSRCADLFESDQVHASPNWQAGITIPVGCKPAEACHASTAPMLGNGTGLPGATHEGSTRADGASPPGAKDLKDSARGRKRGRGLAVDGGDAGGDGGDDARRKNT